MKNELKGKGFITTKEDLVNDYYTTQDLVDILRVDSSTITHWAKAGKLDFTKVNRPVSEGGEQYRFLKEPTEEFIKQKFEEYQQKYFDYQKKVISINQFLSRKQVG